MARTKVDEYSTNPDANTDIDGINIGEGSLAKDMNNAQRKLMAHIASTPLRESASDMRDALDIAIGTNVQAYSANLDEYAAVNPTPAGLALLDDASADAQLVTLGGGTVGAEVFKKDTEAEILTVLGIDGSGIPGLVHTPSVSGEDAYTFQSGTLFNKLKAGDTTKASVQQGGYSGRPNHLGRQCYVERQTSGSATNVFTVTCPFTVDVETWRHIDVIYQNPTTLIFGATAYNNYDTATSITSGAGTSTIEITTPAACAIGDYVWITVKADADVSGSAILNDQHGYDNLIAQSISNHQRGDHLYILDGSGHNGQYAGAYNYTKGSFGFQGGGTRSYIGFTNSSSAYCFTFGGYSNFVDGTASGSLGWLSTVNGVASVAIGSRHTIAFDYCVTVGQRAAPFAAGQFVMGGGITTDTLAGRHDVSILPLGIITTNNAVTNFRTAAQLTTVTPPDNSAYRCEIRVTAALSDLSKIDTYSLDCLVSKVGGVIKVNNGTGAVNVPTDGNAIGAPTWTCAVLPASGYFLLRATGATSETVTWTASVTMVKVTP